MARAKLLLSTSLCLVFSIPAYAADKTFGQIDTNNDGALSRNELASVFSTTGADRVLGRSDRNSDGQLSWAEARSSRNGSYGDNDDSWDRDDGESNSGGYAESDYYGRESDDGIGNVRDYDDGESND